MVKIRAEIQVVGWSTGCGLVSQPAHLCGLRPAYVRPSVAALAFERVQPSMPMIHRALADFELQPIPESIDAPDIAPAY